MPMNRKVQIVRFTLLCFAAMLAAWWWPELWLGFIPIAFFPGESGCFCCVGECTGCQSGTDTHQQQVVLPSTIINSGCSNCAAYRGTWVLDPSGTDCRGAAFVGSPPYPCY